MFVLPYANEPLTDFSDPRQQDAYQSALKKVRNEFGRHYPLIIGGRRVDTGDRIVSTNPANPSETVGTVAKAAQGEAEQALRAAQQAYVSWSRTAPRARARILLRAAGLLRQRKHEFSAATTLEIGQAWSEADGQTAEAIDFLEYYARQMVKLGEPQPVTPFPGEDNSVNYSPTGVGLIIPPWNFPLAILVGTTMAPVVAGNTVILKPATTTTVIGAKFVELLEEAGLPPGVVNFLPGPGNEVGEYLVTHPEIRFINFTGSQAVGLKINRLAAVTQPSQTAIKRVIAEMGGKNALIIDDPCDLEKAVAAAVASAYGFQGQKCSAASRLIVLDSLHDQFVERFLAAVRTLKIGRPEEHPDHISGPVADPQQFQKIMEYIQIGSQEATLALGGKTLPGAPENGYFIEPTVFTDVDPKARIAQEEIFGPVLAILRAQDFNHALEMANDSVYALTGGVFSLNQDHLEAARREFRVGNLYLNRKISGSLVGVQPFGGFKMSGTDAKAGGADYLKLFMVTTSIAERL